MQGAPGTIGRYQILSELGQGAMGVVYLAQDPTLKRKVAIKCMKDKGGQRTAMERFQREAETSSRLNHPNVITVYDVGEDPEYGPFMAMEFVDGTSLATLITRNALTREAGFQVLTQIMYGLMAAHAAGIIHRDVKPENLLVGSDGRVKLMDFGIARGEGNRLTTTGMVVGTPSYTAPELLLGKDASFETDLYAFVVTAFELVTGGELPYSGDSLGVTLYRIVHEPPTIPADLESGLAAVFNKGLHKDPAHRYPNLGAFMTDLAGALGLPAPVMPALGVMPGHGAPSGVAPSRQSSQDEMRTAAVPARKSHGGDKSSDSSADMGRHLAPPPQSLLKHKSSGEQTPKAPAPPRPSPSPSIHARPAAAPPPRKDVNLEDRVKAFAVGAVLVAILVRGYFWWSGNQERQVSVKTTPPGAHVWVDGKDLGVVTNCDLTLKMNAKKMRLVRTDYKPVDIPLTEDSSTITERLKLSTGYFRVLTEPSGAAVYLNGVPIGTSPIWSREIEGKNLELKIIKAGYETKELPISAENLPLEPIQLTPKY